MVEQVDAKNFDAQVLKSGTPVVVDFWAVWCGPCRIMAPIFDELSKEMAGKVKFVKVNVDDNQDLAGQYGIMSIPTLMLFKAGKPADQAVGAIPKDSLKAWIQNRL